MKNSVLLEIMEASSFNDEDFAVDKNLSEWILRLAENITEKEAKSLKTMELGKGLDLCLDDKILRLFNKIAITQQWSRSQNNDRDHIRILFPQNYREYIFPVIMQLLYALEQSVEKVYLRLKKKF